MLLVCMAGGGVVVVGCNIPSASHLSVQASRAQEPLPIAVASFAFASAFGASSAFVGKMAPEGKERKGKGRGASMSACMPQ